MVQLIDTVPIVLLGVLAGITQTTLALRASKVFGAGRRIVKTVFVSVMLFLIFMGWVGNVGEFCSYFSRHSRP